MFHVIAMVPLIHSGYYDSMVFSHEYTDKYPVYIEAPLDQKSTDLPTWLPCFVAAMIFADSSQIETNESEVLDQKTECSDY